MRYIILSKIYHKLYYRTILALSVILLSPNNLLSQINADFAADETNVCSGSSLVFTDLSTGITPSAAYSWDFGEGASPATATGSGPHTVAYTGLGPSNVSLTITDNDEIVTETRSDFIIKYTIPEVSIEDAGPFCSSDETYQLAASPEGGIFSGTGVDEGGLFSPSSAEEGNNTIVYTFTDDICSGTASIDIIVTRTPSTPEVIVENNCDVTSILSITSEGELLWSTGETTSEIIVNSPGTYTVTVTENGCISEAGSGIAAPKTPPSAPVLSSDEVENDCPDETVDLTELIISTTPAEGSLLFKTTNDPTGPDAEDPSEEGEGTYYIFYVNDDGCYSTGSLVTVTLNECARPDLAIILIANPNIVHGTDDITLIVRITELRDISTTGLITVRIARNSGIALPDGLNNSLTSVGSTEVNNSSWDYLLETSNHVFTSTSSIAAGSSSAFGLRVLMNLQNGTGSYTIASQIVAGSGNEEGSNNNTDSEKIDYFSNHE